MSSEILVKQAVKTIAKVNGADYEELKRTVKKVLKSARNYDQSQLGVMEELLDFTNNVSSEEDLGEYDIETLRVYCQIKELDPSGSDKSVRARVWENFVEEYAPGSEDGESDVDSVDESDEEESEEEESEDEPPPPPPVIIKQKKSKKTGSDGKELKVVFEPTKDP